MSVMIWNGKTADGRRETGVWKGCGHFEWDVVGEVTAVSFHAALPITLRRRRRRRRAFHNWIWLSRWSLLFTFCSGGPYFFPPSQAGMYWGLMGQCAHCDEPPLPASARCNTQARRKLVGFSALVNYLPAARQPTVERHPLR